MGLIADQLQLERKWLSYKIGHKKIYRKDPGMLTKGWEGKDDKQTQKRQKTGYIVKICKLRIIDTKRKRSKGIMPKEYLKRKQLIVF